MIAALINAQLIVDLILPAPLQLVKLAETPHLDSILTQYLEIALALMDITQLKLVPEVVLLNAILALLLFVKHVLKLPQLFAVLV
jgi:hypothetical protein